VGVVSFVLLLLTVIAGAGAYLTGLVDGKETFDVLTETGKTALGEHKLLGTYLLLASVIVLFFKLISALLNSGMVKALYILILIAFVLGIFKQGKEGGALVYEHGMNVAQVKTLDDKIFDLEEALEEAEEKIAKSEKKVEEIVAPAAIEAKTEVIKEITLEETTSVEETVAPAAIEVKTEVIKEIALEETTSAEVISDTAQSSLEVVEDVKTEIKEESLQYTEPVQVEKMPEAVQQVQIPTH